MHYTLCDMLADLTQNAVEANSSKVVIEFDQTDKDLTVFIKDDGKGMSEETLKKAQNPFYTDGVKHPGRKVGLGIPFFIQTIEETNGQWKITSEVGKGTTIYACFDLTNIDTPPIGDVPGFFRQILLFHGNCEMEISRKKDGQEKLDYLIKKSELIEALGDLENVANLALLGEFLESQEYGAD